MKRTSLLLIFLLPALFSCKKIDVQKLEEQVRIDHSPTEIAHDVEFIFSDSALIRALIKSPLLESYSYIENPYSEMKEGLEVFFYDKNLKPNASMKADYGKRFLNTRMTYLNGHVVVVNLKNDTLNTEELVWDERKEIVTSDKFVRVKTEDEIIYSEGFETDPSFSYYKFYKIKGTISVKEPD